MHVDEIFAIDHDSFWVKGWVHDEDGTLESLVAVAPEGQRASLLEGAYRHMRVDIQELYAGKSDLLNERQGLIKFLPLETPSRMPNGWIVELQTSTGSALEVDVPEVERELNAVRSRVLGDMTAERPGEDELVRDQVYPAITRIQRRLEDAVTIDGVVEIGEGHPARPELSVIVPLYKRIDFVEHQLAQFARDPEIAGVDLVYVLDSPEVADNLLDSAHALSALHGVPLRVVLMKDNAGFSGANNAARIGREGQPRRAAELRCDPRPARLARQDVGVLRRHPRHRRARAEAALRGRFAAARRDVLLPRPRLSACGATSTTSKDCTAASRPRTSRVRSRA